MQGYRSSARLSSRRERSRSIIFPNAGRTHEAAPAADRALTRRWSTSPWKVFHRCGLSCRFSDRHRDLGFVPPPVKSAVKPVPQLLGGLCADKVRVYNNCAPPGYTTFAPKPSDRSITGIFPSQGSAMKISGFHESRRCSPRASSNKAIMP